MNCSMPGFPVHHQNPGLTQTHVHQVGDAIQPSHPLSFPSPPPSIFTSTRVFSNESVLCIRWPKYWGFSFNISPSNEYSGLISFRIDWFDVLAVQRTLKSKTLDTDFLIAPETRSLKSKCRQIGFYWGAMKTGSSVSLCPSFRDNWLLSISHHIIFLDIFICVQIFFSYKDTSVPGLRPTLMTSFWFGCLSKESISK